MRGVDLSENCCYSKEIKWKIVVLAILSRFKTDFSKSENLGWQNNQE